jgi:hypothetical protein
MGPERRRKARQINDLETGKQLIAAKAALPHGQFSYLIYNELPFSDSTVDRLMVIARHPVLSNSAHARNLPNHWTTLAELSRLPPKKVAAYIKDGTISPRWSAARPNHWSCES